MEGGSSPAERAESERGRTPLVAFERIYQDDPDPWGYASDRYERDKYQRTLAALGERRFTSALEVGCSIGVFTALLAPRCDAVIAIDPSLTALARARERLRSHPNVELVNAAVPEGLPDGRFELVVCSEVLYYLAPEALLETLRGIEQRLAPDGTLVAVHFRPGHLGRLVLRRRRRPSPPARLTGDEVHALLHAHTRLTPGHYELHPRYRLDRFDSL
jgi:SAM-dependent methyltransferase